MATLPKATPVAESPALRAGMPRLPIVLFGVVLAAIFIGYRTTWAAMVHLWNTSDTYAHGWLIAPVSLWCLFRLRRRLVACTQQPAWTGLLLLGASGACWSLGTLADVQLVQQLGVVALVIGAALLVFGWECCRVAAFPLGFLLFAVPMGHELTPLLVQMTADFVVFAVQATGIPLYREGNSFVIPSGSWSVVSGCSGVRYLMATLTVGVLFAYLNYRSWTRRLAFVGVAILVAIVANWLRAFGIVMIAHFSGMKLALGVDHYIYGWVFFGVVIFILMTIGMMWSDTDPDGGDEQARLLSPTSAGRAKATPTLVAALIGLLLVLAWPWGVAKLGATKSAETLSGGVLMSLVPVDWKPVPSRVVEWSPHFVGEPQRLVLNLESEKERMGLEVIWYPGQTQGSELNHAENRLIHEKDPVWKRLRATTRQNISSPFPPARESMLARRQDGSRLLVWQFEWVGGTFVRDALESKLVTMESLLRGRGNAAAGLVFFTPLDDGEKIGGARARLRSFVPNALPQLGRQFSRAAAP